VGDIGTTTKWLHINPHTTGALHERRHELKTLIHAILVCGFTDKAQHSSVTGIRGIPNIHEPKMQVSREWKEQTKPVVYYAMYCITASC
jgi:hypothetical protein